MEFKALRVFVGNAELATNSISVKLTKSRVSFACDNETNSFFVILKKDIKKIEHSTLETTIPFLCLHLSQGGYSRVANRPCLDKAKKDIKRRIFIIFNLEYLCPNLLSKPSENVSFLSKHFVPTTELTLAEVNTLLVQAGHIEFCTLFLAEFDWFGKFCKLIPSEKQKYDTVRNNEHRKLSSYYYFMNRSMAKKTEFLTYGESTDTIPKLYFFLRGIYWPTGMIKDQSLDFIADHQCASVTCHKFSLVKCETCKVARYCDQECQAADSDRHQAKCSDLKEIRKQDIAKKHTKLILKNDNFSNFKSDDRVTFDTFISKIRSVAFDLHVDSLLSNLPSLHEELALRNVKLSDDLPEHIKQLILSKSEIKRETYLQKSEGKEGADVEENKSSKILYCYKNVN